MFDLASNLSAGKSTCLATFCGPIAEVRSEAMPPRDRRQAYLDAAAAGFLSNPKLDTNVW
jgi:hypothetical protein